MSDDTKTECAPIRLYLLESVIGSWEPVLNKEAVFTNKEEAEREALRRVELRDAYHEAVRQHEELVKRASTPSAIAAMLRDGASVGEVITALEPQQQPVRPEGAALDGEGFTVWELEAGQEPWEVMSV